MAKRTRHSRIAKSLAGLRAFRDRPEGPIEPTQTNWTIVPANDNADPEEVINFRLERRLEIVPSIKAIWESMHEPPIKNAVGQTVAIGALRFSDGRQHERAYCFGPEGKLLRFDALMPVGAMLGTKEKADAQSGAEENHSDVTASNAYFADVLGTALPRYKSGTRVRRTGKSYSRDESAAMLADAWRNTNIWAVRYSFGKPGLPCGSARIADSFVGMQKISTGKGGAIAWQDLASSIAGREIWAESVAALSTGDVEVLDKAMTAGSMAEIGEFVGQSRGYADKRGGGKRRLLSANDNLLSAISKAA